MQSSNNAAHVRKAYPPVETYHYHKVIISSRL